MLDRTCVLRLDRASDFLPDLDVHWYSSQTLVFRVHDLHGRIHKQSRPFGGKGELVANGGLFRNNKVGLKHRFIRGEIHLDNKVLAQMAFVAPLQIRELLWISLAVLRVGPQDDTVLVTEQRSQQRVNADIHYVVFSATKVRSAPEVFRVSALA